MNSPPLAVFRDNRRLVFVIAAPAMRQGAGKLKAIEDAPGNFVTVRAG